MGATYKTFGPVTFYRSEDGDRWVRLVQYVQIGYHPNGRRRMFSERNGLNKRPWPTYRVGRAAEVSFTTLRRY